MSWNLKSPVFEYEKSYMDLHMPWAGHKIFAYNLIANLRPKVLVELGTHYGTSLYSFAQACKDLGISCELNAIDSWQGDLNTGSYRESVYDFVFDIVDTYYSSQSIRLHKMLFEDALINFEDSSVDILHIDGLHTYEAVAQDYENWLPKLNEQGVILFHDIDVERENFGVKKFWNELKNSGAHTIEFNYSYGLGVLFLDKTMCDSANESVALMQLSFLDFNYRACKGALFNSVKDSKELAGIKGSPSYKLVRKAKNLIGRQ